MMGSNNNILPFARKVVLQQRRGLDQQNWVVLLEDSCNQVSLPGRVYQYQLGKKLWRWDNLGQDIYIDKYLVTRAEIEEWDQAIMRQGKRSWPNRGRYLPATGLKLSQMESYCHFRGAELISAHLYDAATYHPGDINKINPYLVGTSLYPWTRHGTKNFLYKIQQGESSAFDDRYCLLIYAKECRSAKVPYQQFVTNATSWSGIYEVMGGVPEVMRNTIHPERNIFMSSFYFPLASHWHRLGVRGKWSGSGFEVNDFNWTLPEGQKQQEITPTVSPVEVGFRCVRNDYREIY